MKISLVVDRMDILGGVETHVRDLCHELRKDNHELSIITGVAGTVSEPLKDEGFKIIECFGLRPNMKRPDSYLRGSFHLAKILRQEAPDVVHSHGMGSEMPSRVSSRLLNIPSVHTVHGWSFGNGDGINLKKIVWGGCHAISSVFNSGESIFVSDFNRNHGIKRGYVNPSMSSTIHNGIPDISSIIINAEYSDNAVNIVMVSRLSPEKDHPTVLKALAQIKDLNWTIDFAGKGDSEEYEKLSEDLGIADKCNFLGEVVDIPELLSRKDAFVLATHQEGLPISIIEAMRAKLPVIATSVGGIPEQVEDGKTGYIVPDNDVDTMADRFYNMIVDSEKRRAMGVAGRIAYEDKFSINQMMSKTYSVYDKTIKKHKIETHIPRPSFLRCEAS